MFHVRSTFLGNKTAESLLWKGSILLAAHLDGSITGHRLHTSEYFVSPIIYKILCGKLLKLSI